MADLGDPAEADGANEEEKALADNDWDYVNISYIDAKGKQKGPVKCAKLRGGDDHIIGNGWYAVTKDVTYDAGIIVWGDTNYPSPTRSKINNIASNGLRVKVPGPPPITAQPSACMGTADGRAFVFRAYFTQTACFNLNYSL